MYHSEATLLPDGRVLVSGSDPEAAGFTEELRIEVYIPPYLSQGLTQPIVDGAEHGLGLQQNSTRLSCNRSKARLCVSRSLRRCPARMATSWAAA